ncbi:MAG: diguanylate cyclase [Sulfurimonas sp.]|nr:diguanylate cyclase [Sulfurimonas sp.]MBU3937883.1 diguanylate cyclase [bacterium]MBU4025348.1 diguanylate cyclase [bacterium]MBU4058454.1 diguanylate cyclase [bacterium]
MQIFSGVVDEKKVLSICAFIKELLPHANIIGTTTAGEIHNGEMYDETILLSFSMFDSTLVKSKLFNLDAPLYIEEVIETLVTDKTKALIVFSDGLRSNAEELLNKLSIIRPNIVIAGGRAADPNKFEKTFVFDEKECFENGFVVASLSGDDLIVNNDYMLNWNPIGNKMIVTKAEANRVYELDGMPIQALYEKYLGPDISNHLPSAGAEFPLIISRNGIKIARAPVAVLEDESLLFAGNLNVGDSVQFSYGNLHDIKNSIYDNNKKYQNFPSESIFIYSCSGRKTLMGKELEAEFKMLNSLAPSAGFFTYGEYFHSSKINEVLNITTTFLSLSEVNIVRKKEINKSEYSSDNRILKALNHLTNVAIKEVEYKNAELERISDMMSKTVLYSTSDLNGYILSVSKAFAEFTAYTEEELIGENYSIFRHPDTPNEFYDDMWSKIENDEKFVGDIKNIRKDGSVYWFRMTIDILLDADGKKIGYASYRQDITNKKKLEYISSHDVLTSLYNRREFERIFQAKIKSAQRHEETFGLAIFDIDNFKLVNDTYGHQAGDDILVTLSEYISLNIRDDDFVARWGGEEFVIMANKSNIKELEALVIKLQKGLTQISFLPIEQLTLSFGLTEYRTGDSKDTLLRRADEALYKAKRNGKNRYEVV